MPGAGTSVTDLNEYVVEGTTYNPDAGSVLGLAGLTRNLEALVCVQVPAKLHSTKLHFSCE